MPKLAVTCAKCGFVAFVDSKALAEASGWRFDVLPDGTEEPCCPACRSDRVCDTSEPERLASKAK